MKKNDKSRVFGFSLKTALLFSVLLYAGCSEKEEPAESIEDIQRREGIPVGVLTAQRGPVSDMERVSGVAQGYHQAKVTAIMPGRISRVKVKVGDRVKRNSSLMVIDPDDRTKSYSFIKQKLEDATRRRERLQALSQRGAVSDEALEQVELKIDEAKRGLQNIRKAQFVLAPFSGIVVKVFQNENNSVGPGSALLELASLNKVRIVSTVSDALVHRFKVGQTAMAVVGNDTLTGKLDRVPLAGSAATLSFTLETVFDNPDMVIKPGMYVPVYVVVDRKKDAVVLPLETVISDGSQQYLYVVRNGKAVKTDVRTGIQNGYDVEILEGVEPGEKVVASGAGLLNDGVKVKVVN
ncbi:MAG: efflux RND transporter periplasmic adaptor subunit [Chitinispirillaceae bacterium]